MSARLSAIRKALTGLGIAVDKPSTGSHYKASKGSAVYLIPAHNGLKTEISDAYIKGLCRCFGLDYEAFKKSL